jgi:hypothetical protein
VRGAERDDSPARLGWGEAWGGSSPAKSARLGAECLRSLGAHLGRILLGRKEDNGRVERSHRTDDEEFYLPCVLSLESVEAFLDAGLGWLLARVEQVGWLPVARVEAGVRQGVRDKARVRVLARLGAYGWALWGSGIG